MLVDCMDTFLHDVTTPCYRMLYPKHSMGLPYMPWHHPWPFLGSPMAVPDRSCLDLAAKYMTCKRNIPSLHIEDVLLSECRHRPGGRGSKGQASNPSGGVLEEIFWGPAKSTWRLKVPLKMGTSTCFKG